MVPSVTINGGSPVRPTSSPFVSPRQACLQRQRAHHTGQRHYRADRQVDPADDNHHHRAERGDGIPREAQRDVQQVGAGEECAGAKAKDDPKQQQQ
jgi:hypothetical protein